MAIRAREQLHDMVLCRHNIYVKSVYIQYKNIFAHHLCGQNVRKGLLESIRKLSGGVGHILLQSVSLPRGQVVGH